jgi:hypothetical protein
MTSGRRIAWVDSGGTVRYYWGDHLGTTRMVTDASGNVCYTQPTSSNPCCRSPGTPCTDRRASSGSGAGQDQRRSGSAAARSAAGSLMGTSTSRYHGIGRLPQCAGRKVQLRRALRARSK